MEHTPNYLPLFSALEDKLTELEVSIFDTLAEASHCKDEYTFLCCTEMLKHTGEIFRQTERMEVSAEDDAHA